MLLQTMAIQECTQSFVKSIHWDVTNNIVRKSNKGYLLSFMKYVSFPLCRFAIFAHNRHDLLVGAI